MKYSAFFGRSSVCDNHAGHRDDGELCLLKEIMQVRSSFWPPGCSSVFAACTQSFRPDSADNQLSKAWLSRCPESNDDGSRTGGQLPHGGHYQWPAVGVYLHNMGTEPEHGVLREESARQSLGHQSLRFKLHLSMGHRTGRVEWRQPLE